MFSGSGRLLLFSALLMLLCSCILNAQAEKKYLRKGNREYEKGDYSKSEISYRRALDKNKESADAVFNAGDALYKQGKYEDAVKQFSENYDKNESKGKKAASLYNLGNSLLKANKLQESIDAYKASLKLNPESREAKYNLAYAQDMLVQQQQQQQKDQDKKDQDKKDQDKKDQQNKDQNKDNKDQNKDKKDQDKQQQNDQQQQQKISKEDAERLLKAIEDDEKDVQEKVKLAKAAKEQVKTVKNW